MSLRTPLAALVAAASLAVASPAVAVAASAVSAPANGAAFAYAASAPGAVAVSGTADSGSVDLRCAAKDGASWDFGAVLPGGSDVPVSGGSFSAPSVSLPTSDAALCRLVAVPHGITPTDLTGLSGPNLRLLIARTTGIGKTDNNGGTNQGTPYDHYTTAGGSVADTSYTAAGDSGLDAMYLLSSDPGELGRIFSSADRILELDPTGPAPSSSAGEDGPLTGILVDGVNAFTGYHWERAITPALQLVFRDYTPFPRLALTINPALTPSDPFVQVEVNALSACTTTDPMWYPPQGFTCQGLRDSGVRLTVSTFLLTPAGNVVDRYWRFASTDGRPHTVALWLAHTAAVNASSRSWKLPGDGGYLARSGGETPAAAGAAPWIARFVTPGASDGDASEGVGAFATTVVPSALRFAGARELDAKYAVAVPATGDAELHFVYVGDATQAALESDLAAAFAGPGDGGRGAGNGSLPRLTRTGKALLRGGALSLGYSLACPADALTPCRASVALTQPVRRAGRRHGARARAHHAAKRRARRARPRVLGRLSGTIAPGKTVALRMTIARRYRAAFRAGRITMTARLDRVGLTTQTVVKPLPVKIVKPRASRRAHRRR